MRVLLVIGAVLFLFADPAWAQTPPVPPLPTRVELLVIPAIGDANTVKPVATSSVLVSLTSPNCNFAPSTTPPPTTIVNPTAAWEFTDPYHEGRVCRAILPTGLPTGSYRVVAVAIADSCNPTGTTLVTPCPGPRSSVGTPPFSITNPIPPPAVVTGLRST